MPFVESHYLDEKPEEEPKVQRAVQSHVSVYSAIEPSFVQLNRKPTASNYKDSMYMGFTSELPPVYREKIQKSIKEEAAKNESSTISIESYLKPMVMSKNPNEKELDSSVCSHAVHPNGCYFKEPKNEIPSQYAYDKDVLTAPQFTSDYNTLEYVPGFSPPGQQMDRGTTTQTIHATEHVYSIRNNVPVLKKSLNSKDHGSHFEAFQPTNQSYLQNPTDARLNYRSVYATENTYQGPVLQKSLNARDNASHFIGGTVAEKPTVNTSVHATEHRYQVIGSVPVLHETLNSKDNKSHFEGYDSRASHLSFRFPERSLGSRYQSKLTIDTDVECHTAELGPSASLYEREVEPQQVEGDAFRPALQAISSLYQSEELNHLTSYVLAD